MGRPRTSKKSMFCLRTNINLEVCTKAEDSLKWTPDLGPGIAEIKV